jgi:hypothetical protein
VGWFSRFTNPFAALFARSDRMDRLSAYVIREHRRGRDLADILEDPFIRNRTNEFDRERLLDNPEVVRALGEDTISAARGGTPTR